ncbi:MAG TPA: hypothetical protein VGF13_06545 [Verrucomicrobiae bacterium]|jgi:hypothetical protein
MKAGLAIALTIALCLVLSASLLVNVLQQRTLQQLQKENARLHPSNATAPTSPSTFADIPPGDLSGTYKWIINGEQRGTVTLHADGSITNWRGEKKSYQWQLWDNALALVWLKDPNVFTRIIAPGIYEGKREGKVFRMEKEN